MLLIVNMRRMQPRRGCGRAGMVRVRAGFGTRLISILVREYEAYYLTKVEIVGSGIIRSKKEEEADNRVLEHSISEHSSGGSFFRK